MKLGLQMENIDWKTKMKIKTETTINK